MHMYKFSFSCKTKTTLCYIVDGKGDKKSEEPPRDVLTR